MTTLVEHAQSLIAATIWGDNRILEAADGITAKQYAEVRGQFEHMLGTQRYWHGNWTGGEPDPPHLTTLGGAREAYAESHATLSSYVSVLTQAEWDRTEQWWLRWGVHDRLALGESITQVFYHGIQHRSEIAIALSLWGRSPGDLDYITFLSRGAGG